MNQTAILVASFGSTHTDTLENNIARTEAAIGAAFPGAPVYRAFTSKIVRTRLEANKGIHVDSVEEALARIAADGYTKVLVQPTLLIPGVEYDRLNKWVAEAAGKLTYQIGRPLLCGDEDIRTMVGILRSNYPVPADTVLLAMGHGTYHAANDLYIRMEAEMKKITDTAIRVCTVEGTPNFDDAIRELTALPQNKVTLIPMLLVAGDHAKNDMAGEEPDSLRGRLAAAGLDVTCIIKGLGELEDVQKLFVARAQEAAAKL